MEKSSEWKNVLRRFRQNKIAMLGLFIFLLIALAAILVGFFLDYDASAIAFNIPERLHSPSGSHLFGTDEMGRDVFARVLFGARYTLSIGLAGTLVAMFFGGILGSISGYFGGLVDDIIMRILEVVMCLPSMLLAIAIVVALGNSISNMVLAIGIANVPHFARIVRSAVMGVRNTEYVQAAKVIGTSVPRIITKHILRNCLGPIIVDAAQVFAQAILSISSLSFLGLGIKAPTPEWGNMLAAGKDYIRQCGHLVIAPGMAIFLSIFSLNLVGDGLRDALDPRMDIQ